MARNRMFDKTDGLLAGSMCSLRLFPFQSGFSLKWYNPGKAYEGTFDRRLEPIVKDPNGCFR